MRRFKFFWRKYHDKILSRFKQVERCFFKTPDNLRSHSGNKWVGYLWETFQIVGFFALLDGYSLRGNFQNRLHFCPFRCLLIEGSKNFFGFFFNMGVQNAPLCPNKWKEFYDAEIVKESKTRVGVLHSSDNALPHLQRNLPHLYPRLQAELSGNAHRVPPIREQKDSKLCP